MTYTLHILRTTHPRAGVIICGDRNQIEISSILSIDPSLRQTVRHPTRGLNILDIICTNLHSYYLEPVIIPPLQPDNPETSCPSDHNGIESIPFQVGSKHETKKQRWIRPLPESMIQQFENDLSSTSFEYLHELPIDAMVSAYQDSMTNLLDKSFPLKLITISDRDQPWFNEDLRLLRRQKQREYTKNGNKLGLSCAKLS